MGDAIFRYSMIDSIDPKEIISSWIIIVDILFIIGRAIISVTTFVLNLF